MKNKVVAILAMALVQFTACAPVYYVSNSPNIALLKEKGDFQFEFGLANGNEFMGTEMQGAYAISDHFLLHGNVLFAQSEEDATYDDDADLPEIFAGSGRGSLFEVGGGYFTPLDPKKQVIFETTTGLGYGTIENKYTSPNYNDFFFKYGMTRVYLQPAIGFSSKKFEIGAGARFNYANYRERNSQLPQGLEEDDLQSPKELNANPNVWTVDPSAFIRAGFDGGKVQLKYTHPLILSDHQYLRESPVLNLGIVIQLKQRLQRKPESGSGN